jgi:hypothetical protein
VAVGLQALEALLSNKSLGAGGATIISAWLTRKDNGALSSLDLSFDTLGVGALAFISAALKKRINDASLRSSCAGTRACASALLLLSTRSSHD